MKLKSIFGLLATGLLLGCVPSLNPLYTDKDVVFDPALVGSWTGENAKETWSFQKSGEKAYKLTQTDAEGHTALFEVHLVQLQDYRFLDLYVLELGEPNKESKINSYAGCALIPGHMFLKVTRIEPTLQMACMDPDWLRDFLQKNPNALRHKKIASGDQNDERIVLTAETKDLQSFILKHIKDEKIFGDPGEFKKKEPTKS
jgi:hypothetical protein